jgi:membrane associated rhomboid family serine protease
MLDDRQYMRTPYRPGWSMTTILCVTLAGCYLAQMVLHGLNLDGWVDHWLALSKTGLTHGLVFQLLTYQFLHGSFLHLLFNVIGLYFFGRAIEEMLGSAGMLKLYLASGVVGGLLHVGLGFAFPLTFGTVAVVGASAGIFGLVAAFATRAPDQPITLLVFFILPVTFRARALLIIEGCIAVAGVVGPLLFHNYTSNIAHGAHLGGMLTGIAWIRWSMMPRPSFSFWRPLMRRAQPRRESARVTLRRVSRSAGRKAEELPPAEFISREVDPILEKISARGIHSLTERERQILEAARSKMARR